MTAAFVKADARPARAWTHYADGRHLLRENNIQRTLIAEIRPAIHRWSKAPLFEYSIWTGGGEPAWHGTVPTLDSAYLIIHEILAAREET